MKVKKKTFEMSSLKKYRQAERNLWLIPLACLIFTVLCPAGKKVFNDLIQNPDILTVIGIVILFFCGTLVLSVVPFFIGKIIIRTQIKTTIQNCTITSIQDFEYYRDKLTGLSPAVISILTDLEIEQKKDVAASILQYENLGLLTEDADQTYHATDKFHSCNELNESDRYLIEHLEKCDFDFENDMQWKQLVMEEAVSEGYVSKKIIKRPEQPEVTANRQPQRKAVSIKWRFVQILLGIVWVFCFLNAYQRMSGIQPLVQNIAAESREDLLLFLYEQPKVPLVYAEFVALFISAIFILSYKPKANKRKLSSEEKANTQKGCLVPLAVVLFWFVWTGTAIPRLMNLTAVLDTAPENASLAEQVRFISQNKLIPECIEVILMFIYLMFMVAFALSASRVGKIIMKNNKPIKRTDYGNHMAECIYGMKNFIHDYSNLNEADRRQVVLWEDYLVYAVVLEENEEIVSDISRTRREVL